MLRTLRSFSSLSASTGFFLSALLLSGCGAHSCNFFSRLLNEPSCKSFRLSAQRVPIGGGASCAGSAFSRKVRVQCPLGSGTTNQCSSLLAGGTVYALLVPNNSAGSFVDATGVIYSNCGPLLSDFFAGTVQTVSGFYSGSATIPGDTVACDDTTGCTLNPSQSCFAGWTAGVGATGTAALPNGTSVLACVYIDNSFQVTPPAPPSINNWNTDPLTPLIISGDPTFTSGWRDAY